MLKAFRPLPILILFPLAAGASCGTNFCPRHHEPPAAAWQARWSVERSGYDLAGSAGAYSISMLDLRYQRADRWIASVHVPFIALNADDGDRYGFGNPMAMAEYRWHPSPDRTLGAGLQLEAPWGDDEAGVAQPHYMAVPYLSASARRGAFTLGGNAGVSVAFGEHHHEEEAGAGGSGAFVSPVHPHEDFEAVYRVALGYGLPAWRLRPAAFVNGQRVIGEREHGTADDYLSAGIEAPVSLGRVEIIPRGEVPISADHRFEWTLGLGLGVAF